MPPAGSSCVDSLTGVPITFPMIQQVPATLAATITAISLLSEPAKSDPTVREVVSDLVYVERNASFPSG